MYKIIFTLSALIFLTLLWGALYLYLLKRKLQYWNNLYEDLRSELLRVHDALPMLFEVLKSLSLFKEVGGREMLSLRNALREVDDVDEQAKLYTELREKIEDILASNNSELKKNSYFLFVRGILEDADDRIHSLLKKIVKATQDLHEHSKNFPGSFLVVVARMRLPKEIEL